MGQLHSRLALVGLVLALAVELLSGCGGHGSVSENPTVGDTIVVGPERTIEVTTAAGQVVTDSPSGLTFLFPTAGHHRLTVASITQAPALPFPNGRAVRIRREAPFPLALRFALRAARPWTVYYYATATGCYDRGVRPDMDWQGIPARTPGDGFAYFDLPGAGAGPGPAQIAGGTTDLIYGDPPPDARSADFAAEFQRTRSAIQALSPAVRAALRNVPVSLNYRAAGQYSYYQNNPFYGPSLYFRADGELDVVTHETCHYLTHMLMTDALWSELERTSQKNHDWGVTYSRDSSLAEDYAYLLQWLAGRQTPPRDVATCSSLVSDWERAVKDTPSREGFAAVLLCALISTDLNNWRVFVPSFANMQEEVPNFGATPEEVALLLTQGATTFNQLWDVLETFVTAKGYPHPSEALEALVERLGWSYSATCRITTTVPTTHTDIAVWTIKLVRLSNGSAMSFETPRIVTRTNEQFTLPRVFPGASLLHVQVLNGPVIGPNLPIEVQRDAPTTTTIDFGDWSPWPIK